MQCRGLKSKLKVGGVFILVKHRRVDAFFVIEASIHCACPMCVLRDARPKIRNILLM